jgi:SAM-dependent methyltransferase
MSGFSSDWLALREPADGAARSQALVASVADFASSAKSLTVLDLGAGTGSTLRALAPHLPTAQRWMLVDHDASLVAAGRRILAEWAEATRQADGADDAGTADRAGHDHDGADASGDAALTLRVGGRPVSVSWRQADLARADWPSMLDGVDLVTASALFDLVSAAFIERFSDAVAQAGAAVYVALDVDGTVEWSPGHADDAAVAAAFRSHQGIDKGFGPALGPEATAALTCALTARGYAVRTEKSPWRLGPNHAALITALAEGWADAARAAGLDGTIVDRWLADRRAASGCVIGHSDLFAMPPPR